jgi:undecaprenyl-diphosphatase
MDLVQTIVLAVVQGLTEFLPISSSGHLVLTPAFAGWTDQGLAFDIAVHFGTLAAVITYFRHELWTMARSLVAGRSADGRFAWQIIVATVPLGLAGLVFADVVETSLRSPAVIAASSAGFGLLLWLADRYGRGQRAETGLGWRDVLLVGCGQALALIPGTSRSGITMTVGLALGLTREAAGRFSFLLSVPAIGMVAAWQLVQFLRDPAPVAWGGLTLAVLLSAATAFVSIAVFLNLIGRIGMGVFALYRIALAVVIVVVLL